MSSLKLISGDRVARLLVAILVGTLFVPVTQMSVPQLLSQSQAAQITTLAAPTVTAVTPATGGLNVTWTAPPSYSGSSTVTGYQVEYSVNGTTYLVASNAIASTTLSYTITGLTTGTDYFVRVAARNSADHGAYGYFWSKLYSTSNPTRVSSKISYDSGFGLSATGSQASNTLANANFSRVRYEFTINSGSNRASVDFNRFTSNTTTAGAAATITNLAIPDQVNTFAIKSNVTDMTVYSTVSTLNTTGVNGHLEIWPSDYGTTRNSSFSFGSDSTYDANDTASPGSYGSFQVFNTSPTTPNTIFAWNNHGNSNTDLGINSNTSSCGGMLNADWTFCGSSAAQRTGFNLSILINVPVKVVGPTISYTPVGVTPSASISATPVALGGSITSFSVSASTPLPATLAINSTTGVISGTAPGSSGVFTYTINAISDGSTSLTTNFVLSVGLENSICFSGSNQYLSLTTNTNLPLGNTAYTIEAFVKSSTPNIGGIAAWGTYGVAFQSNAFALGTNPRGYRNYHWGSDLIPASKNNTVFNDIWHHVVAQFDGTTKRIYENGIQVGTNSATLNVTGTTNFTIGKAYDTEFLNGCISNLRIVKGVAVYSGASTTAANFTVPTTFLTRTQSSSTNISAITGNQTVLLMNNQSNILQDASTFGYTLTKHGTPTISASGPSLTSAALTAQAALTLNSTSGTYGTPLRLTTTGGTGTGAVSYATLTSGCNITNTDSLTVTGALTCSVTATKAADATYSAISSSATNVVFATRPITIKAAARSATYTGSSVSVSNSYSITSGTLAGSDTFTALTYTYTSAPLSYNSVTAPTNAGSYTITPSAASFSVGSAGNYTITYETATLTIGVAAQAALTLNSTSSTYGTTLRLTTTGGSGTGAVTYVTGTAGCNITNTDSLTVNSALTCSVTASKAASSNHAAISSSATNVVFSARLISIKAAAKSASYTGSSVSVSNSYSITSGTLAGSDTFTALTYTYSSGSYSASQTAPTNAGIYTITPSAASFSVGSASNYNITYETATLTIATRAITIKATTRSATYTGSSVSVSNSYSITSGTLAGSDTFTALTYTYTSTPLSYNSVTAPTNAGSYTITPSAASFSVGSASSYVITYETATLTIDKANQGALTITTTTSKYGTPLRLLTSGGSGTGALSFAITSAGTASGCSITNETLTVSSVGTCNVTATKALDTNYLVVSSIETVITFAKAETITVTTTLSSNSVTYNELPANVTVTQTVTGLVNSETATVTATYTVNACQSGGSCAVGDVAPGGGYVFHVSATPINAVTGISAGGIYLATAPHTWYGGAADPTASWGCSGTDISGTSAAVGAGAQNTWLNTVGCATAGRASRLAADSSAEGFTDWFMPSSGELNLMYINLKLSGLSNLNGTDYWSSTQDATNPASSAMYRWFGGSFSGPTDKNNTLSVRPIRAFSPTTPGVNTIPTDAGTYLVAPSLTLSGPASINNYQAVEYVSTTLTINKARQRALSVGQYESYPNISTYPLNIYGGSGPGIVTRSLISSGSAGCSISQNFFITATNVGSCDVQAVKAGTLNYFAETTTATITWIAWSANYAIQSLGGNNSIAVAGGNQFTVRTETVTASAFTNVSGSAITSAAVGTTIRINSTGFAGLSPAALTVTFRPYEDAVITAVTSTYVEVVIPPGSVTGVIAIDSPRGVAYTGSFTISP